MLEYLRLSHILDSSTPSYGNRDKFIVRNNTSIASGSSANSSTWIFTNNHIGTHIDVPYHFSDLGIKTFEIPISQYFFKRTHLVDVHVEDCHLIDAVDIQGFNNIPDDVELLLIRTGYEKFRDSNRYWESGPGISSQLPTFLRLMYPNLRCLGFDFISISSWGNRGDGKLSHQELLSPTNNLKPIWAIEDMRLSGIKGYITSVVVAPIFVSDGNGAPVTVFAECENNEK